ncbi:MAG: GTPase HflX, partial [Pseudomonadota bacterium]
MTDLYTTETTATRAWVLHPDIKTETQRRAPEHALGEAVSLAVALPDL